MLNHIQGHQPLIFRSFTFDTDGDVLFTHDITGRRTPAYEVQKSALSRHKVSRISGDNWNPQVAEIGGFKVHTISSRIDVELHGHSSQIRRGTKWRPSKHTLEWPPLGNLEWKEMQSGKELYLLDEAGRTLARCVSKLADVGEHMGSLEILVPGDDKFVDMCVVTSLAKWRSQETPR